MNKYVFIVVCAWIGVGAVDAGFLNASLRKEFHDLYQDRYKSRKALSASLVLGFVGGPIALIITPFLTGFYQDGWTLDGSPSECTSKYPDIWCNGNLPKSERK